MRNYSILSTLLFSLFFFSGCEKNEVDDAGSPDVDYTSEVPINFSFVGYKYGLEELPSVPARITLEAPSDGSDATEMIQEALDKVRTPGAVLLKAGTYKISSPLNIRRSGVVLRGEGDKSIIKSLSREQITVIYVGANSTTSYGSSSEIIEEVPLGQMWVKVASPSSFAYGDMVSVKWQPNDLWIHDLKMDQMTPKEDLEPWVASDYIMYWERKITHIDGDKIWFDAPIVMELTDKYTTKMTLVKTTRSRISESGVESLCIDTVFDESVLDTNGNHVDENHAWTGIGIRYASDCWVKNVKTYHLGFSAVSFKIGARCCTVKDCISLEPVSQITGSRRYAFYFERGELCMFANCLADKDRHGFVTNSRVCGPNVCLNCTMTNAYSHMGPHHRWSTGVLFDNCKTDEIIELQDRGNYGTGHGWASANCVLWNCEARDIICQNPWVSAMNWSIGSIGIKNPGRHTDRPDGIWISPGQHVQPVSLYQHQLDIRKKAIKR